MKKEGASINIQPSLLEICGPQPLFTCLPYGAVTNCNKTKEPIPIDAQITQMIFKVVKVMICCFYETILQGHLHSPALACSDDQVLF